MNEGTGGSSFEMKPAVGAGAGSPFDIYGGGGSSGTTKETGSIFNTGSSPEKYNSAVGRGGVGTG